MLRLLTSVLLAGSFVTQTATPSLFNDKTTAPGISLPPSWNLTNVLRASEINSLRDAVMDLRTDARSREFRATHYGATDSTSVDSTAGIQAAVDAAQAAGGTVYLDGANFKILSPIAFAATTAVKVRGRAMLGTTVKAGAAIASMFSLASSAQWFAFEDLVLDGNHQAVTAILGAAAYHNDFRRLKIQNTTTAALSLGGWNNTVSDCKIQNNDLDGIRLTGTDNNIINVVNTVFYLNPGVCLWSAGGGPIHVRGSTFESCFKTAIYIQRSGSGKGLDIVGNYFEANSVNGSGTPVGLAFTSPYSKTVQAEIILNGAATSTTMDGNYPTEGADVSGNFFGSSAYTQASVWVMGVDGLELAANVCVEANPCPLIAVPGKGLANPVIARNVSIRRSNRRFSKDVLLDTPVSGDIPVLHTLHSDNIATSRNDSAQPRVNYINQDIFQYTDQAVAGGTLIRSAVKYNGFDVFEFAGNTSDRFGQTISVDNHPEMASQLMQLSAWVKGSNANHIGGQLLANGYASINSIDPLSAWQRVSVAFVAPASGTFTMSLAIQTAAPVGGDKAYFSKPVLSFVGVDPDEFYTDSTAKIPWSSATAPTAGTWVAGDTTYAPAPASGGYSGVKCTTGGTPGTWKSWGAIL